MVVINKNSSEFILRLIKKVCRALILSSLVMNTAWASKSVQLIALFNEKAMFSVDNGKPKVVRAGSSYQGVTLISSNTKEAVIEFDGRREVLKANGSVTLTSSFKPETPSRYKNTVELRVNEAGFFESDGAINGKSIRFLVDTGANIVVLNSHDAKRVGLNYLEGERTSATTASGAAPMYSIEVAKMSIGGIELRKIRTGVIEGNFPEKPLLGMTFLSRLDMNRSGDIMKLTRR